MLSLPLLSFLVMTQQEYIPDPSKLIPGDDGYIPVDFDDFDNFHCSKLDSIPWDKLYEACLGKSTETPKQDPAGLVEWELRQGAYPGVVHWSSGKPVDMACAVRNFTKSTRKVADRGADLTKTNRDGFNACQRAAARGFLDVVKTCHEKGVDLITPPVWEDEAEDGMEDKIQKQKGCKHPYVPLASMGKIWDHMATTKFLLELGRDPDARSRHGCTCMEKHANTVMVLGVLKKGRAKTKKPGMDYNDEF